ncbi:MAG: DNA mismatch repair protein MutS [Elusimicrobia bacterium]|nr:DNA mismatch repair protein MutS [Elusimicrobiota bacterium]
MSNLTPLMFQYERLKKQYPDCIIFFRLGDFYEMFGEDAKYASSVLQIVLTARQGRPMCGVPFHSAENYLSKLVHSGKKVAIVEQLEEPTKGKKIVERDVIRVVSPGTLTSENVSSLTNSFVLSVYPFSPRGGEHQENVMNCVLADVTTGEMIAQIVPESDFRGFIRSFDKIKEVVFPEGFDVSKYFDEPVFSAPLEKSFFCEHEGRQKLKELFKVASAEGFEMDEKGLLAAFSALFSYLEKSKISILASVRKVSRRRRGENLFIDAASIRNLELVENLSDSSSRNTLFGVLNKTLTPAGSRLLKRRILSPSAQVEEIKKRQSEVKFFLEAPSLAEDVSAVLSGVADIERSLARISLGSGVPKDFMNILTTLRKAESLKKKLENSVFGEIDLIDSLRRLLERAVYLDAEGYVRIKPEFNPRIKEIDKKLAVYENWLDEFQKNERTRLDISKLKVGYNSVFGYYIEVSKANLAKVPPEYKRKQTLVNCERFITDELKEKETEILILKEEKERLRKAVWQTLSEDVKKFGGRIKNLSQKIAEIDVALSFAAVARGNRYTMPDIGEYSEIEIENGRHPVVEKLAAEVFTPNSVKLDSGENQVMLITGPNMAGKSTYIRSVALCVIMAQAGAAIPASSGRIGIVDRIFTRIGSGDNLAQGASTFMVEMIEAANILNNSTEKSLIVIDELGRGTSTYDGISIAWSCLEYIAKDSRHPRCLFATHFFELVELENSFENIKNYHLAVREFQGKLHFLHKIERGSADRSYGIHVAELAGLPPETIEKAREILQELEAHQFSRAESSRQIPLFETKDEKYREIAQKILRTDIDNTKPIDALKLLEELKKDIK